ncbi:MAG TPA: tRNA pseudouridine(55) synthase TruB [Saprospiraceae bacterium]|nr:tRNA pseudouridine(55) synthase TruB [Saprospiraceae bacterium]
MLLLPTQALPDPLPKDALLLVDKPLAWTSFDVVNRTRYLLTRRTGDKKLKVGHAGTLDPLATGLLVLCVGKFTKRIEEFQAQMKEYTGSITFGATRASFDLEKPIDATFPTAHLSDELLEQAKQAFLGDIMQVPPIFSAVKVDGRRVYKNARTGEEVALPHRPVQIAAFDLGPLHAVPAPEHQAPYVASKKGAPIWLHPDYAEGLQCEFRVLCSKGTYIRSLAHDLGQAVGSGACLSALRRTASGGFSVQDAWTVEKLGALLGS